MGNEEVIETIKKMHRYRVKEDACWNCMHVRHSQDGHIFPTCVRNPDFPFQVSQDGLCDQFHTKTETPNEK